MLPGTETQSALQPKYPLLTRPAPEEKVEFAEEVTEFGGDAQPCGSGTQALREEPVSDLARAAAWFWGVSLFGTGKIMVLRSPSQALFRTTPPKNHQVGPGLSRHPKAVHHVDVGPLLVVRSAAPELCVRSAAQTRCVAPRDA